jgi:hypothetical protein
MSIQILQKSLVPKRRDGQPIISDSINAGGGSAVIVGSGGGGSTFDPTDLYTYINSADTSLSNWNISEDVSIAFLNNYRVIQDSSISTLKTRVDNHDTSIAWLNANKVNKAGDTMTGVLEINTNATIALQVDSTSNSAITNYGGLSKNNYASQTTGYRVSSAGEADFRYLYADQLHVKSFIADLEQATSGSRILCKSVAKIASDFTLPTAGNSGTLIVEEFAGFTGNVFADGDMIRIRQFSRANYTTLNVADAWGTVTFVSRNGAVNPTTQSYTFSRSAGSNAGSGSGVVKTGTLALDYGVSGQGILEETVVDGINGSNSPYTQIVTWTGHPVTGSVVRDRDGNLAGINDAAFGGALSGYGKYCDNVYLKGKLVIAAGSSGYANITDKPTIPTNTNQLTDGANLGGTAAWGGISSIPTPLTTPGAAGLYVTGSYLGYYNGSTWPSYIDNAGNARFVNMVEFGTQSQSYAGGYFNTAIKGADIWENSLNGTSTLYINLKGYAGGTTQYRNTLIGDGKGSVIAEFFTDNISFYQKLISPFSSIYLGTGDVSIGGKVSATGTINSATTMTATNFIGSSDERLKDNIKPLRFKHIPVKYKEFTLKSEPEQYRVGAIAQELKQTNPEFVREDKEGFMSIAYIDLLMAKVAELEARIKELEAR